MVVGTSLVVQWLRLRTPTARLQVQSMVKELRSCMLCSMTKKKKKKFSSDYTNALFLAQDKSLGYRLKKGEALSSQNLGKPHRLEFPAHP